MTERIKLSNIKEHPQKGIFITEKDRNILLISLSVFVSLLTLILKTEGLFKYKIPYEIRKRFFFGFLNRKK